jgi:serine/threonine protein phosphatase PrpC
MRVSAFGQTDVGLKRSKNEDNLLVDEDMGLFIVADGMGGHKGGDLASQLAVESMRDVVKTHREEHTFLSPRAMLEEGYTEASSRIFTQSQANNKMLQGMGTTLVSAYVHENEIFVGNVGDSRAYYFNKQYMWQMTEDHSLVNEHIRAGLLKDSEAKDFQAKNIITRSVGFEKSVRCDIIRKTLSPGDMFLLCSDGLCGLVEDDEIHQICRSHPKERAVELCVERAKEAGGDDNITALIITIDDD